LAGPGVTAGVDVAWSDNFVLMPGPGEDRNKNL
jgi:hypothetical protein